MILTSDRLIDWSTAGIQSSLANVAGRIVSGSPTSVPKHLGSNIPNRPFVEASGRGINVTSSPYLASGSSVTTTGSISGGSTALTVASSSTFSVGQGIIITGALRTTQAEFTVTQGATSNGNISFAVHGTDMVIALTAGDTINQVATKIRNHVWTYNGGTITTSGSGAVVHISYDQPGGYGFPYTNGNTTGADGSWNNILTGSGVYVPVIAAISGNNITVDTAPTTTVTGVVISHADGVAIQNAIDATPPGEVCYIPAGTYGVGGLRIPSNITVRGAGPDITILKFFTVAHESTEGLTIGRETDYNSPSNRSSAITGATKGATSFTCSDITFAGSPTLSVGNHLVISELNDSSFVSQEGYNGTPQSINYADGWDTGGVRCRGQIVKVESIAGSVVTFTPALYSDYTLTPWATRMLLSASENTVINAGLEDLTIYATALNSPARNICMRNLRNCWLYNIKSDFTTRNHVLLEWGLHCEIRKSHFIESFVHGSGDDSEIGIGLKSSHNLIIDNIIERLHVDVLLSRGAAGNVIAYNLCNGDYDNDEGVSGSSPMGWAILMNHGAHPQYNLAEGNVTGHIAADMIWGSSSHSTIFRNWMQGRSYSHSPYSTRTNNSIGDFPYHWTSTPPGPLYEQVQAAWTLNIYDSQSKYSVIGNVIGDSTTIGAGFIRRVDVEESPSPRSYFAAARHLMSIGFYDNLNNSTDYAGNYFLKFETSQTIIDHGNYAFAADDPGQKWEPSIADHTIPNSLFLASKPDFMGNKSFPPFNPSSSTPPTSDQIPAGHRWMYGNEDYLNESPGSAGNLTIAGSLVITSITLPT